MRDHLLTVVSDADLAYKLPGENPTLGELLVRLGAIQGVYTHSFETFSLDWTHHQLPPPAPITIAGLQAWFAAQDEAMKDAGPLYGRRAAHRPDRPRERLYRVAVRPARDLSRGGMGGLKLDA